MCPGYVVTGLAPSQCSHKPQDITPPMIANWLKQPVARAHVLLDRKGKTLSHVFVEMVNEDAAKVALRTTQNSVLGQGKRARGVTVTRSSQEELMKAVSPLPLPSFPTGPLTRTTSVVPILARQVRRISSLLGWSPQRDRCRNSASWIDDRRGAQRVASPHPFSRCTLPCMRQRRPVLMVG